MVYGAAFDEKWGVSHREVSKEDELPVLQGSKYVQSSIGFTYTQAKENLESGKMVLFSGTPCQIAEQIDACVRLSGLSKQDYITKR